MVSHAGVILDYKFSCTNVARIGACSYLKEKMQIETPYVICNIIRTNFLVLCTSVYNLVSFTAMKGSFIYS